MRALGRLTAFAALIAVAAVAGAAIAGFDLVGLQHFGKPRNVLVIEGQQIRIPLPDGPDERQAPTVPVSTEGDYSFMFEETPGEPTRYDPCRPLEWTLNPDGMPEGAEPLLVDAIADVEHHSGLVFDYGGETDEVASFDRALFQDRYGERLVPIIVGWSTEQETPDLEGSVTGLGGSTSVNGAFGEQRFLAGGVVILDSDDVATLLGSEGGPDLVTAVMRHELAHVIGLSHVDDPTELMNEENTARTDWGPGDRAGLAIAGAGPCQ